MKQIENHKRKKGARGAVLLAAIIAGIQICPRIWQAEAMTRQTISLRNTGFEEKDYGVDGWTYTLLTGEDANWKKEAQKNAENAYQGSNSFQFWFGDEQGSKGSFELTQEVYLEAGTYTLSAWSMGDKEETVEMLFNEETGAQKQYNSGWKNWSKSSGTFQLKQAQKVRLGFRVWGSSSASWGYVDEISLTRQVEAADAEESKYTVNAIDGLRSDFIRGVDVSSLLSEMESGVVYRDFDGKKVDGQGFFDLLADSGVNYARFRVWNDPYDSNKNGYGGGNCDLDKAIKMGKWATNAGMKVLIDFHYSDFWADPEKQFAPKAWNAYSLSQKETAIESFTKESLNHLLDAGVDVAMVQVGNETNNAMCGVSDIVEKCKLYNAGSSAIRAVAKERGREILVALHFTDPQKDGNYEKIAGYLQENNVDYDVFASSYYPFWHGTTDNLTNVLKNIASKYHKKVMVAETSYVRDLQDHDGKSNNVGEGSSDLNYEVSGQGQVTAVSSVMQAVADIGDAGLGAFYWEPAWIPVQEYDPKTADSKIYQSNMEKWERYGSGWATSYAKSYDEAHVQDWYGGTSWDNQSLFYYDGCPDQALRVFRYVLTGTRQVDDARFPHPTHSDDDTKPSEEPSQNAEPSEKPGQSTEPSERPDVQCITLDALGGTISQKIFSVTVGKKYGQLPVPFREGYRFLGWYTKKDGGSRVMEETVAAAKDNDTLYAHWTTKTYQILYRLEGGKNNAGNPTEYTIADQTIQLAAPTREGYRFDGWYADSSYCDRVTEISAKTIGNRRLYAKWTKLSIGRTAFRKVVSAQVGALKVSWKAVADADGYELTIAQTGKNGQMIRTTACAYSRQRLKSGKSYTVAVRAYQKDSAGKRVYGKSRMKTIKIK